MKRKFARIEAFYALQYKNFSMGSHTHTWYEIMYAISGNCKIFTNNGVVELREREFVLIGPGVEHRLLVTPDTPCYIYNLEFSFQDHPPGVDMEVPFFATRPVDEVFRPENTLIHLRDCRNMGSALNELITELQSAPFDSNQHFISLHFIRTVLEMTYGEKRDKSGLGSYYVNRAVQFITEHLTKSIDVERVAKHVCINKTYLQTLFSKCFGCGIMTYVNEKRMQYAAFLVCNTDKNISDVAYDVGFNSRQHFGVMFQKYYKMSPSKFRKKSKKLQNADTGIHQHFLGDERGYSFYPYRVKIIQEYSE